MNPIPISAAEDIAKRYDYDQIIIIGRKVGTDGGEHVTTYGKNEVHCDIAAMAGDFLKYKVMGWVKQEEDETQHLASLQAEAVEKANRMSEENIQRAFELCRQENKKLAEALRPFAERWKYFEKVMPANGGPWPDDHEYADDPPSAIYLGQLKAAYLAIKED